MSGAILPIDPQLPVTTTTGDLIGLMLKRLSTNSQRQYAHTFNDWRSWCVEQSPIVPLTDLTAVNVMKYLEARNLSRGSAQNRLSHLRGLVQAMSAADLSNLDLQQCYAQLKWLKLGVDWQPNIPNETPKGRKRKGQYIDPAHVHELLSAYPIHNEDGSPYLRGIRNRALLAVLFYTGLRRFEAAKLEWSHIDFNSKTIKVVGGKARARDAEDVLPFLGSIERYLLDWRGYIELDRMYAFPRVLKGSHLGADKPITPDGLYKQVSKDFAPHDARRTLISDLLNNGSYIGDVKVISRHANEATLLKYAKSHDANVVGVRVKLGY
jgi:integrase